MAGGDNRDRIAVIGHADGSESPGASHFGSQLLIRPGDAVGNPSEGRPDAELEGRAALVEGEVEGAAAASEVFGELRDGALQ